jgi:predicted dehydrogenase
MAHVHVPYFLKTGRVDLVAISDIRDDNADLFRSQHKLDVPNYHSYHEMLAAEKPEIVSITTWPHLHAEMAVAAAEAGAKAIHCEKPMATTWADAKRMKAAADANGAKLTLNHQRRHLKLFQAVRQAVRDGAIGDLVMVEVKVGDMFDWGTHWLDKMFLYNEETPAEWVMGQIDSRTAYSAFGARIENQAICHFKWQNGVRGFLTTGYEAEIGAVHRLVGTKGILEVLSERKYRVIGNGEAEWKTVECPQGDLNEHDLTTLDVIKQLDDPTHKSLLSADNAIHHTEVIFATYYSGLYRGRVDLPLEYGGNALHDMLDAGLVGPDRREA